MIEPTVTQNSALYLVHHKASEERAALFRRLRFRARKQAVARKLPMLGELLTWPRLQGGN